MKLFLTDDNHLYVNQIYDKPLLNIWIKNFIKKDIINIKKENNNYVIYSNKRYKLIDSVENNENFILSK